MAEPEPSAGLSTDHDSRFPRWLVYAWAVSRVGSLLLVLGFLLLTYLCEGFLTAVADLVSSEADASGIFNAIVFFRIYNKLHVLVLLAVSLLVCCLFLDVVSRGRRSRWAYVLALTAVAYLVFTALLVKLPIWFLPIFFLINLAIRELNVLDLEGLSARSEGVSGRLLRYAAMLFVLVPLVPELLFPSLLIFFFRNSRFKLSNYFRRKRWGTVSVHISMVLGANIAVSTLAFLAYLGLHECTINGEVQALIEGRAGRYRHMDFYSMQIDQARNRLLASNPGHNLLYVFDLNHPDAPPDKIKIRTSELQDMRINPAESELYHFDRSRGLLLAYDLDELRLSRQSAYRVEGQGSARVAFDNRSRTVAVTREGNWLVVYDMDTLAPLRRLGVAWRNEYVLFDDVSDRYVLSYFDEFDTLLLVPPNSVEFVELPAGKYQGQLAVSPRRRELYLAMPLRRKVFVYDMTTLRLKHKIPTVFGVRGLAYDEANDLLVAASMCTGYVDVIDLRRKVIVERKPVGYYLREICLVPAKREAYVSSLIGGIYRFEY